MCVRDSTRLHIRDELHVLRRADVLAKVDLVQLVHPLVVFEVAVRVATREIVVPLAGGDLPREETGRDGHHLITLAATVEGHCKGEHGIVLARGVLGEGQAVGHRLDDLGTSILPPILRRGLLAEEARVAASDVAGAHDVAEDHDVLGLGDDGLGAAGQTRGGLLVGVRCESRPDAVPRARSAFAYWQV